MPASVRVLLFATAREAVGRSRFDRAIPADGVALRAVLDAIVAEHPKLARVLSGSRLVVNGEVVRGQAVRLQPGDEIGIHPPYSGG